MEKKKKIFDHTKNKKKNSHTTTKNKLYKILNLKKTKKIKSNSMFI